MSEPGLGTSVKTAIATARMRIAAAVEIMTNCAQLLGINEPPTEERPMGDTIDQLMEGFDTLDDLGASMRDQLNRL